ncbi:alpha/beta fold hydrolase [Actinomadura sp. LD22]|uniref:Alpha/beta fold hydrolase n=1 Tax=Actinomadura physcomitrii TaxID=2650748 RepID=A0A6I4MB79_9ACTN|nr:alpha/beta hydrolase [Actinomadura physcomitrii]MVZ99908.1 alpha/beta fold hydrolase [Actinomadura physcomitrii]
MIESEFEAEVSIPGLGDQRMAGTLFSPIPERLGPRPVAIVAVPGGTYDRSYWHLRVPTLSGYSFAEHAVTRGVMVLALDNLGTGASSRPADGRAITVHAMADAVGQATAVFERRLRLGSLPVLPALPDSRLAGLGHSLGGQIIVTAQARHRPFGRIGVLGGSFIGNTRIDAESERFAADALKAMAPATWDSGYLEVPRELLRGQFHDDDVPEAVLKAEEAGWTVLPRQAGITAIASGVLAAEAAQVEVPVLVAFSERDTSPAPRAELPLYERCRDLTFFGLTGSAHCHNAATTRHLLWDRLLDWTITSRDSERQR